MVRFGFGTGRGVIRGVSSFLGMLRCRLRLLCFFIGAL
jgi:hypothetical protein